jgi:hypothetical protein
VRRDADNYFVANIPAASWLGGQVIAINIPCSLTFNYAPGEKNLRIQYFGTGVTPYYSGSTHFSNPLKTWALPVVSAGPDQSACAFTSVTLNGSASPGTSLVWTPGGSTYPSLTIFPSATTTYTLTGSQTHLGFWSNAWVQKQFTCTASDQAVVTVMQGPSLHLQNYTLCDDDPMPVLDGGSTPVSYQWFYTPVGGGSPVSVGFGRYMNTALHGYGTYNVIVYGANGCSTSGTSQVLLSPSAASNLDASFSFDVTNDGTFSDIHAWSNQVGTHWWAIYESNENCTSTLTPIYPPVTGPSSVNFNDLPLNQYYRIVHKIKKSPCNDYAVHARCTWQTRIAMALAPNPTTGSFTMAIENYDEQSMYSVTIYDRMGTMMETFQMRSRETTRDISAYQPGIYTIILTDGTNTTAERIMKN